MADYRLGGLQGLAGGSSALPGQFEQHRRLSSISQAGVGDWVNDTQQQYYGISSEVMYPNDVPKTFIEKLKDSVTVWLSDAITVED